MANQRKSHVFRVTGLSRELPDEDLKTALQKTLSDNFADNERSHIQAEVTIVPSCYESDSQRVALVQFRGGVPQFLHELRVNPMGDWQVEMGDDNINIDCHFFGFTQLYTPADTESVAADIIAIAGLDGHAYGSWQGRGKLGRMWLRDFLSKDLPQCRTMIYGYNSKLSSHGVDTILDYGRELMEEIKKIRNTKELQQRPLIFIAHSFGGIVLAHCLVRAIQTMDEEHPAITSLHQATYGMILFAIPHKDLVMDDIQQMLGNTSHPREHLLRQISSRLDVLIHQLADFKNLIRDRKVVSFYETEQTRRLVLDSESGRWKRSEDYMTTVDADSALLQLPDHMEDKVPLHADHSMVVKFDTRHVAGYRTAVDRLRQFIHDAPSVVAARFTKTHQKRQSQSTVPFKKDPMFVGREAVISAIIGKHGAIGQCHERVALVGLGGVGKTQIAIEYAYRVRESTPDTWVFWIHASNAARLEQGYQEIAAVTEIPGRDDPKTNLLQLVYQWLCDARNGRWLMVLDNADDDSVFFGSNTSNERGPLVRFLPHASHGSILLTSRNGLAAQNLVGNDGHVIAVQPMNEEDSLAVLRARITASQSGESGEDEKSLVQALEYIPLAIAQAGSYIANRSPRVTVSRYLELFHESESNQSHLLQYEDSTYLRRDPSIRHASITTWQLSFEQIRHERPAATDLLALMSMFDRQGIPEALVLGDGDGPQSEDAVAPLISYSLVRVELETASFEMHRLVQLSVRSWLEIHAELSKWQKKSRAIMAQMFPNGRYENWTECQRLLPHAKEVMKSISDDREDRLHVATISFHCGWYLCLRGTFEEAEVMHRQALTAREEVLGYENPDTLMSVDNLGLVLSSEGKYEEAEVMHQRALKAREKVLGHEHPDTLTSVNNLGLVLFSQGRYEEAKAMHQQALEVREKVLGREHPDTLSSVSNLGSVLFSQGKYKEAETVNQRALEARERVLGCEHPETLSTVNNLGLLLSSQGKYEEAEAMHRWVIEVREKVLGREHPDTLVSVSNLGNVFENQGKYEEAEVMHRRTLELREKVLGCEHPDTLISVSNLGSVLESQGKYEEAEVMYRQALEVREQVLGREHPDTLSSVNNLGSVLSSRGQYKEAEVMHRRDLKASEKVLGREHPNALISASNLGSVLSRQGKYEDAEVMHRWVLEAREKVLGREHPYTLSSISNLGSVLDSQGRYEEAEVMHRRALEAREKVLGREHPDTLTSVSNLCLVLSSQGKYEEAEAMHRRDLEGSEKVLGREHPDTLTSVSNLGNVLFRQGKYEEAEVMHQRVLEAREKVLGREHPYTLSSISNLGSVLDSQGRYEEAEVMYRQALKVREKVLGCEHLDTLSSVNNLGSVLSSQGKYEEAEAMHQRALEGYERVFGGEHPNILASMANLVLTYRKQGRMKEAEHVDARMVETRGQIRGFGHLKSSQFSSENAQSDGNADFGDSDSSIENDSVFSVPVSIPSTHSMDSGRGEMNSTLIQEFANFLKEDGVLLSLILTGVSKEPIGFERMRTNFRRLLRHFANDLEADISSELHRDIKSFVSSYSVMITGELFAMLPFVKQRKIKSSVLEAQRGNPSVEKRADHERKVETYLQSLYRGSAAPQTSELTEVQYSDDEASDQDAVVDEAADDEPYEGSLQNLDGMKKFIIESDAYRILRHRLKEFVQPSLNSRLNDLVTRWSNPKHKDHGSVARYKLRNLVADLQHAIPLEIRFERDEISSPFFMFIGHYQHSIEQWTGEIWDWWPLPRCPRPLTDSETRLRWKCVCGEERWAEIPNNLLKHLKPIISSLHKDSLATQNKQLSSEAHTGSNWIPGSAINSGVPSSQTSTQGSRAEQPANSPPGASSLNRRAPGLKTDITETSVARHRVLLVVKQGGDYKLSQICVSIVNCHTFFSTMKKEYFRLRGVLRVWLSIWRYSHCDFYKFEKFDDHEFTLRVKDSFPEHTNTDYDYQPKPMNNIPPISEHEFTKRFYACSKPRPWLHLHHKCKKPGAHCSDILNFLPKKMTELEEAGNKREYFWGIYAREYISLRWVIFYNFVCVSPLLAFFLAWIVPQGPGTNLQDPYIPLSMMAAMLSLFWSVYFSSLQFGRSH